MKIKQVIEFDDKEIEDLLREEVRKQLVLPVYAEIEIEWDDFMDNDGPVTATVTPQEKP